MTTETKEIIAEPQGETEIKFGQLDISATGWSGIIIAAGVVILSGIIITKFGNLIIPPIVNWVKSKMKTKTQIVYRDKPTTTKARSKTKRKTKAKK